MAEIVVADVGETHARFAIASIEDGKVAGLSNEIKMKASEHASFQIAWETYGRQLGRDLPQDGALAVAGPVGGEGIYFTNSSWMIRPALIPEKLKLNRFTLVNDFGAVGDAVAQMDAEMFSPICGPDEPLTSDGIITVVGPGTGLGVAHIMRRHGDYHVLTGMGQREARLLNNRETWELALSGGDSLAAAAFDHFCLCLGSVTGDLALAQGARSVVMAGGLGRRIAGRLHSSGFRERFIAKGRFQSNMEALSVKQLLHEEAGLYGAAAAFIHEHGAGL